MKINKAVLPGLLTLILGCGAPPEPVPTVAPIHPSQAAMTQIAETYVRLVLAMGAHDPSYVDAFYGPTAWQTEATTPVQTPASIQEKATQLVSRLDALDLTGLEDIHRLRKTYLRTQLNALLAKVRMVNGEKLPFDQEAKLLYDVTPPTYDAAHFEAIRAELEALIPGTGPISERFTAFRRQFVIPQDKIDAVFKAAITEARKRTGSRMTLPPGENFVVEYVTDKPWSAYNWYKGNYQSLIQVNVSLPIFIDRAIDLACHEGYPGHHVYNALLEKNLVNDHGFVEFSVYPLFSPQSLIAEGSGNYGIRVAFPKADRLRFEQEVLFPIAGLDPATAEKYYKVLEIHSKLSYAGNEAARGYLDGTKTREETLKWLQDYALYSPEASEQRVQFIEKYRSYVINYNLGQDLVATYVERHGGTEDQPDRRWGIFKELLSSPMLPSDLNK